MTTERSPDENNDKNEEKKTRDPKNRKASRIDEPRLTTHFLYPPAIGSRDAASKTGDAAIAQN